jgi:hypothetical protein
LVVASIASAACFLVGCGSSGKSAQEIVRMTKDVNSQLEGLGPTRVTKGCLRQKPEKVAEEDALGPLFGARYHRLCKDNVVVGVPHGYWVHVYTDEPDKTVVSVTAGEPQ